MSLAATSLYDFRGVQDDSDDRHARVSDYISLLKPRVMTLVVFTAIAGMVVAPGDIHPVLAVLSIAAIALGSGAAGAMNMWYDRDIDAVMSRTKNRAIPAGRVPPADALAFGIVMTIISVMVLGLAVNWVAAGLLLFASWFYVHVYTMLLKRSTPQNIVIGGAAGAFPPMIGWAAVTGGVDIFPVILFAIIFLWTPPHFWALALYKNSDYKKAGVPMLPVVSGARSTKVQMLIYTLLLFPLCTVPYFTGDMGLLYLGASCALNAGFIFKAMQVLKTDDMKPARAMFGYSIVYLFALFTFVMIDGVVF